VGSLCAFCAIGFLECLKVTFSMTLQATALTRSSSLLGCLDGTEKGRKKIVWSGNNGCHVSRKTYANYG